MSDQHQTSPSAAGGAFGLAWLPIPLILSAIVFFRLAGLSTVYEAPLVMTVASFLFWTATSLLVAILIGRGFQARGSPGLLLLGCGVLIWGAAGTVAPMMPWIEHNTADTVHNVLIWLAAACTLAGALVSLRPWRPARLPGLTLALSYTGALCAVWLVAVLALEGWLPVCFVEGRGNTWVGYFALSSAGLMFAFASAVLWLANRPSPSAFVRWYVLALLLVATGLVGLTIQFAHDCPVGWMGRAAQFLGGVYLLAAALASVRETGAWRLQIEAALREQIERYDLLVAGAEAAIWDWDLLDHRVTFSPQWKALRGYAADELSDREEEWSGGIHPEDAPRVTQAVAAHCAGKTPIFAEEYRVRRKDGGWIWIAARGLAQRDASGRAVRMAGSEIDVTGRKEAEEALRQSERKFRIVAENTYDFEFWRDPEGRFLYVSPSAECVCGYAPAEFMADPDLARRMVHPEDRARFEEHLRSVETADASGDLEYRIFDRDGYVRWIAHVCQPVFDESGNYLGVRGSNRDVTDRKATEENLRSYTAEIQAANASLRESRRAALNLIEDAQAARRQTEQALEELHRIREDLDRAQEVGHIGSWRLDVRRNVLTWSDENHRILGVPKGTPLTYETFLAVVHSDDRRHVDAAWQASLGGKPYEIEHRIIVAGEVRWVYEKAYLELDEAGKLLGGFGIAQDITDRKRAEESLREINETLEHRVAERTAVAERRAQDLRRLAAELCHAEQGERQRLARLLHDDLQQLLLAVRLYLAGLAKRPPEQFKQNVAKLDELLGECLDTSRNLSQELSPPVLQYGTLSKVVEWLGEWFGAKHGLTVVTEAQSEIPSVPEHVRIFVFQAVRELLANVVKHSGKMEARIALSSRDGDLAVQVEDGGSNFEPHAVKARLKRPEGFGLFNIQERVEALGGRLEIQATPRGGARFRLVVPVAEGTASPPDDAIPRRAEAARSPDRKPRARGTVFRLLVVDDHAIVREGFVGLLGQEPDFEVVGEASDGEQAVRQAEALRPDAIIMDVDMPTMDGIAATRRIKQQYPEIVVVGLSLYEDEAVVRAMIQAGADSYVSKNAPAKVVVQTVRRALSDNTTRQ